MSTNRPTPEIRTRFTLGGLRTATQGLRAFGDRVRGAASGAAAAARRVGAAMRRVGTAAVAAGRRAATGIRQITRAAMAAATRLRGLASTVSKLALGGFAAGGGAVGLAIRTTSQLVTEQERLSRASGAATSSMIGLTSAASAFGVESDEVMGALSTLTDKMAEAARGEGAKEFFNQLGVGVTDASGRLRDSTDVLNDLMASTRSMNWAERANVFNELLGGDAEKLAEFLDVGGRAKAKEFDELARSMGAIATRQHVQQTRRWREALERGRLAMRGVALEISARFMPVLTRLIDEASGLISDRRSSIADFFVRGWNSAMRALRAALGAIAALSQGVRATIAVVTVLGTDLASRLAPGLGIVGGLVSLWLRFLHVVVQVYAAFIGRDDIVRSGWILSLRDGVMSLLGLLGQAPQAISRIAAMAAHVPAVLAAAVEVARVGISEGAAIALAAAGALVDAIASRIEAAIDAVASRIAEWTRPVREAIADVFRVLSQGAGAKVDTAFVAGIRDELVSLREVAIAFWESLQRAWAIFKTVLDTIHTAIKPLMYLLGTDVMTMALVVGMLKLSGILGGVALVAKGLGWAFKKAFGVAGGAATGFSGRVAGLTTAVSTLLGKVAAAAGIAVGGYYLGGAVASGIDSLTGGRLSGRRALEAQHDLNRRRMDDSYYRRLATAPRPVPVGRSEITAANAVEKLDLWNRPGARGRESVDVNFNVGGRTAQLSGTRSAVDELTRALNGARAAGGLR